MFLPNIWPSTASFEHCGIPAFEGKFVENQYEGIVSEPFREAFHSNRLKAYPAHEVECIVDEQNEVIGYNVTKAKFNLAIEPLVESDIHNLSDSFSSSFSR